MALIELRNVSFAYSVEDPLILKNLSFEINEGECVLVEGDNGSGKSTLFRILNGLSFPEKGSYLFDGTEITRDYLKKNRNSKLFHKRIGYLFQNPDIMLFNSTVFDEIAFGPRQMGLSDSDVEKRVNDCMKLFCIEELGDKAPYHLSGGQKKKVAFASVIALNPDVIILDEPYTGLDRASQEWLTELLKDLKKNGKTLIIASHNDIVLQIEADRKINL